MNAAATFGSIVYVGVSVFRSSCEVYIVMTAAIIAVVGFVVVAIVVLCTVVILRGAPATFASSNIKEHKVTHAHTHTFQH